MEWNILTEGAELFNYIYFADNKKIYIYDDESVSIKCN